MRGSSSIGVVLASLAAGILAILFTPVTTEVAKPPPLAAVIPKAFGGWTTVESAYVTVEPAIAAAGEVAYENPYDDVLSRSYRNAQGDVVMLSIAYSRQQRQEVKLHRPELCYPAQGFQVKSIDDTEFQLQSRPGAGIHGKRMLAVRAASIGGYSEAVSYWMRIGRTFSAGPWQTRWHLLREGLAGRIPDGILVRASAVVEAGAAPEGTHLIVEQFLSDMVSALPQDRQSFFTK